MPYLSNMDNKSAAGSSGSSGTRSTRERALNLLRVVQNLLETNDDVEQGRQSSQDEAGPSASGEQGSTRVEVCLPVTRLHREACHLPRQLQKGKKACMSQKKRGLMNSFAWRIVLGEMLVHEKKSWNYNLLN